MPTILDAAKAANISIPTLCYFKGLCDIGACRVCCVEVEGDERLSRRVQHASYRRHGGSYALRPRGSSA